MTVQLSQLIFRSKYSNFELKRLAAIEHGFTMFQHNAIVYSSSDGKELFAVDELK